MRIVRQHGLKQVLWFNLLMSQFLSQLLGLLDDLL